MRFKPSHRTRFLIGLMLCVGATGFWVWKTRTQGNDGEPALARLAARAVGVDARPSPEGRPPSTSRPGNAEPRAVQKARAELEEVRQTLAAAQAIALEGVPETDHPAALARFAQSHASSLAALSELESRLRDPQFNPAVEAPLPGLAAAQVQFEAVRQLIQNEGLSLEEAEAQLAAKPPQ